MRPIDNDMAGREVPDYRRSINMSTNRTDADYQAGYNAFKAGQLLSDKPDVYRFGTWEIGWHDAHAEMTRLAAKR